MRAKALEACTVSWQMVKCASAGRMYEEGIMRKGFVEAYYGPGKGKTSMALGQGLRALADDKSVIIIQFLKGREKGELYFLEESDVDMKLFCFEKTDCYFEELSPEKRQEQRENIRNGLGYARKVIATHECDLLILDEILGLPEYGVATPEEIRDLLKCNTGDMHIILTGRAMYEQLQCCVNEMTKIETQEVSIDKDNE